jgi:hypothetical protein
MPLAAAAALGYRLCTRFLKKDLPHGHTIAVF